MRRSGWPNWTHDQLQQIIAQQSEALHRLIGRIEAAPPHVRRLAAGTVLTRLGFLTEVIEKAESPIELLLGVLLADLADHVLEHADGWYCELKAQQLIEAGGQQYRADFVLELQDDLPYGDPIKLVIECDGHDYHERTKQQAARDRRRDRAMQAAGYQVFRFTGSEIWNDPYGCVQEISSVVDQITRAGSREAPEAHNARSQLQ